MGKTKRTWDEIRDSGYVTAEEMDRIGLDVRELDVHLGGHAVGAMTVVCVDGRPVDVEHALEATRAAYGPEATLVW
jgi:hypothetical protein